MMDLYQILNKEKIVVKELEEFLSDNVGIDLIPYMYQILRKPNEEMIKLMLEYKLDLNRKMENNYYPIQYYIACCKIEKPILKLLIENSDLSFNLEGFQFDAYNNTNSLYSYLDKGKEVEDELIKAFLVNGTNVNHPNGKKAHNCLNGYLMKNTNISKEMIELFLQCKAQIDVRGFHQYPLQSYLTNEKVEIEIIQFLLDKKASLECQDEMKNYPIDYALNTNKSLEIIEFLVSKKSPLSLKNSYTGSAIHSEVLKESPRIEIIQFLMKNKLDINMDANYIAPKSTPLHLAISSPHVSLEILEFLVENSAAILQNHILNEMFKIYASNNHYSPSPYLYLTSFDSNDLLEDLYYPQSLREHFYEKKVYKFPLFLSQSEKKIDSSSLEQKNFSIFKFLIEKKCEIENSSVNSYLNNEIFNFPTFKLLVENGVDLDFVQLIRRAVSVHPFDVTKYLFDFYERSGQKDDFFLHYFLNKSNFISTENIKYLVDKKCDINSLHTVYNFGSINTPIQLYSRHRSAELNIFESLIELKADPFVKDSLDNNLLHFYCRNERFKPEILEFFLHKKISLESNKYKEFPQNLVKLFDQHILLHFLVRSEYRFAQRVNQFNHNFGLFESIFKDYDNGKLWNAESNHFFPLFIQKKIFYLLVCFKIFSKIRLQIFPKPLIFLLFNLSLSPTSNAPQIVFDLLDEVIMEDID